MPKYVMRGRGEGCFYYFVFGPGVIHQSDLLAEADIDGKIITFCPFG
jgi:hypothetical protein